MLTRLPNIIKQHSKDNLEYSDSLSNLLPDIISDTTLLKYFKPTTRLSTSDRSAQQTKGQQEHKRLNIQFTQQ